MITVDYSNKEVFMLVAVLVIALLVLIIANLMLLSLVKKLKRGMDNFYVENRKLRYLVKGRNQ